MVSQERWSSVRKVWKQGSSRGLARREQEMRDILIALFRILLAFIVVPMVFMGLAVLCVNLLGGWGVLVAFGVMYLITKPFVSSDGGKKPRVYEPTEDAGGL